MKISTVPGIHTHVTNYILYVYPINIILFIKFETLSHQLTLAAGKPTQNRELKEFFIEELFYPFLIAHPIILSFERTK